MFRRIRKGLVRPEGTVDCQRFGELIRQSQNEPVTVYVASNSFKSVRTHVMDRAFIFFDNKDNDEYYYVGFHWNSIDEDIGRSMLDLNMPLNGYNDWFLFEDLETAENFMKG